MEDDKGPKTPFYQVLDTGCRSFTKKSRNPKVMLVLSLGSSGTMQKCHFRPEKASKRLRTEPM